MAVERSDFELGVISDPRAIKQFLGELEVIPAALKRVAAAINAVDLGDGRKFQGDGRVLAEGLIQGFRGQLASGNFQRAFREAMSGVDLRIPAEAQAHLRSDLQRIAAEVQRILPKQVLIGVRANTTPEQFRQAIPQAFQQQQQLATGVSLAQARAEARELRAQNDARAAELGTARGRTQGDASGTELLKAAGLVDRTSERYQNAAARLSEATAAGARTLERVATREETRAHAEATFPGGPDTREGALARATEEARTARARRQLGLESSQLKINLPVATGPSEPIANSSFRAFLARQAKLADDQAAEAQKLGSLQSRAGREMEAAINKQHEAALKENAAVDRARALTNPNSPESVLQRAAQTSVNRRIAAQRALEDTTTPLGQKLQGADIGNLVEQDVARRLQGAALAQQRRDRGPIGEITAGVFGTSGASFLERQASIISTTASFAVGGKIFEGVMKGIDEVINGTRQFEEALSRLSIMFNDSTGNLRGFATEVGAAANNVGLTQAQGIEVASKSVGLFNTSQLSEQDKKDFALQATEVTARISQQSGGKDLVETETNLAGILRSFQLSNSDLTRVEDALAVISKQFGHTPADVLKATAETGTLANEAGFDPFTAAAIIANQATTTGQSASASATQVAQLFSKETNQNIETHFQQIGIDTTKTLAEQFTQLRSKVQSGDVSRNELDTMAALFGRARAGGALLNLVNNLPRINAVASEARNSPGEGQKQFEQEFGNINGEIRRTVGALKQMATELSQSGLLDILGELIYVIHQGADALTELLHLFNELPRPLRSAALQLTELGVAIRLIGGAGAVSKSLTLLASLLGGGTGFGGAALTRLGAAGLAERTAALGAERAAAKGAIQEVIPGLEAAGGAAAGSGAAGSGAAGVAGFLANPIVLGAVAAATVLIAGQKIDDANRAADRAESTAGQAAANARTAEDLRGAASSRRSAATAEDARRGAFLGLGNVVDFFTGHDAARTASQDRHLADSLDQHANQIATAQEGAKQANEKLFGRFQSPDEVAKQLARLSDEGLTAAQRVKALSDAFDEIAHAANQAGSAIIPAGGKDVFTQGFASAVSGALGAGADQAGNRSQAANGLDNGNFFSNRLAGIVDVLAAPIGQGAPFDPATEKAFGDVQKKLQGTDTAKLQGDVQGAINQVLANRHIDTSKGDTVLSKDDVSAIQEAANGVLQKEVLSLIPSDKKFDEIRRIITDSFRININDTIKQFTQGALTPDQAVNFVQSTFAEASNTFAETSFKDRAGASATRVKTMKAALDKAKGALASQGNDEGDKSARNDDIQRLAASQIQYDQALAEDQKVQLDKTLSLVHLRESKRGILDQTSRLADEIDAAQAAVNAATDPTDRNNAQTQLNNLKEQQAQQGVETAASIANSKIDPRNTGALAAQAVKNAQANLTFAKGHGDAKAVADATTALDQAQVQSLQTNIAIMNARHTSRVKAGDDVSAAKAELDNAQGILNGEIKGTEAYYNTLTEIKQLQKKLADVTNQRLNNQRLLRIDLTDPVAQAHAAVQAAQDAFNSAKGDDKDRAGIDLRQKRAAEEAAKFQQRLGDVQTADQLGRISHQQYMTFLQSEHDRLQTRLRTMKTTDTGYRDAVNELNQIDSLIKEAGTALSGQFNLGDIKLPTVYEVRRAIKAGVGGIQGANNGFAGAGVGQVVTDNSQRTLILNGVPLDEVMKRIYQLYGGKPVRTTTTRKR